MRRLDRQALIGCLNDAHAMEAKALPLLRHEAMDPRERVDVRARLESHFRGTAQQAERLRQALHVLGSTPTAVERDVAPVMVLATDITGRVFSDPLVKQMVGRLAAKQFEVA